MKWPLLTIAAGFTVYFVAQVLPGALLVGHPSQWLTNGYVNPVSSGYTTDTLCCWLILAVWIVDDARRRGVRRGWIALLLAAVPGVAVGFALYLLMRQSQLQRPSA
jgi:Terpene cyclase DEP1